MFYKSTEGDYANMKCCNIIHEFYIITEMQQNVLYIIFMN